MTDLPKQYDPHNVQQKWFVFWEQHGYFNADPNPRKQPHAIMIPLPNVTGALHMGHALNGTCQDLITRWRRMQGYEALWMPGTDHAGIATQAVVERRMLEEEGLTRHDIGRESLVNRIWKWKDAYERRILGQLKRLGASCDWRRTRFTLDEVCSKSVRRTFFKLFKEGLIYRGKRLVNWDTYLQTAVSDDEVFEEDVQGHFWTFHYYVIDGNERISFSTTRPETMLGDTAVCVHPDDARYRHLIGCRVRIPLNGREIPIIADGQLADPEMGTGAVKVTPAHDQNDYACYQRHLSQPDEIGIINILNPDGTINAECGNEKYVGKDRYAVREMVIEDMAETGQYEGIEDRLMPIKHSDRSKTSIEPFLSDQWFVKMDDHDDGRPGLAQMAMDAVEDGRVRFFPDRYAKTYLDWLGEKRDWCISRQLWWGHRIPVWSKSVTGEPTAEDLSPFGANINGGEINFTGDYAGFMSGFVGKGLTPGQKLLLVCVDNGHNEVEKQLEDAGFEQDPDVLDTWFSSALWPHSTLGWPDTDHNPPLDAEEVTKQTQADGSAVGPDAKGVGLGEGNRVLDYFYPTSVLVTSRDIITLWVARMVLTGLYNMGDVPFHHVCVHPKILDGFGQTMSKSKGNGVDPVDLIDKYGTDAIRFTIASFAGETQDVRLPISYECPHCGETIPQKLYPTENITYVVPETLQGEFPASSDGTKPRLKCPQCGELVQFSTPAYDPDDDELLARTVSERFEYGRNFCNKLWNAARFAMMNLDGYEAGAVSADQWQLEDRWILSRLSTVVQQMNEHLGRYQFDAATRAIRDFTWNAFCDWYLEMLKPRLRDDADRTTAQRILVGVLDALIRLLQPFTPYLCEELWQRLHELAPRRGLGEPAAAEEAAIIARWPEIPSAWQNPPLEKRFERLQETIIAVRNVRAVYGIPPNAVVKLFLKAAPDVADDMQNVAGQFENLAKTQLAAAGPDVERPPASASFSLGDADGFIPLEGVIDREAELARQQKELEKLRKHISGHQKKLANENFVNKAPAEVVANVRETLSQLESRLQSVEEVISDLQG